MAKKNVSYQLGEMQPDEINALRALVKEFIGRLQNVDNEIEQLKEDRKEIVEEYADKLDTKTLKAALRAVQIKNSVQCRDTFDLFVDVLTDPAQ